MKGIRVEIAQNEDAFASIRDEWTALFAESGCSPFSSWEWLSTWFRWFGSGDSPFIVKTYRDDKLIGILPLICQARNAIGMRVRRLAFAGEGPGGADHLDLIARSSDAREVLAANLKYLSSHGGFDIVCLDNLDADSQTASFLRTAGHGACARFVETVTSVCPKIDLTPGWSAVLKDSRRSTNFKRRLKQLEKLDGFEFRSITSSDQTGAAFERFLVLHEKRWAPEGGSELSGHPRLMSFQRDLAASLASTGLLHFDELWIGDECVSSAYGLDDGTTFYYYNAGYDPKWSSYSVGLVLAGLSIRAAVERGIQVYDFLRGEENYKYDWASEGQQLIAVTLVGNSVSARAFLSSEHLKSLTRRAARTMVPAALAEPLKQWHRRSRRNFNLSDLEAETAVRAYGS
jgi:CelD/BcsL family acetyltransferase involved in cellulose biosynthesis